MSEQLSSQLETGEYSLVDFINFLLSYSKIFLSTVLISISVASGFLIISPPQYETTVLLQLPLTRLNENLTLTANENSSSLLAKVKMGTWMTSDTLSHCYPEFIGDASKVDLNKIDFSKIKGSEIIQIKVSAQDELIGKNCVGSLYNQIKNEHAANAENLLKKTNLKLSGYADRLKSANKFLLEFSQSSRLSSVIYLSTRDEIKFFNEKIDSLNDAIFFLNTSQPILLTEPVTIKKTKFVKFLFVLLVGFCFGLIFGFILVKLQKIFITK